MAAPVRRTLADGSADCLIHLRIAGSRQEATLFARRRGSDVVVPTEEIEGLAEMRRRRRRVFATLLGVLASVALVGGCSSESTQGDATTESAAPPFLDPPFSNGFIHMTREVGSVVRHEVPLLMRADDEVVIDEVSLAVSPGMPSLTLLATFVDDRTVEFPDLSRPPSWRFYSEREATEAGLPEAVGYTLQPTRQNLLILYLRLDGNDDLISGIDGVALVLSARGRTSTETALFPLAVCHGARGAICQR